MANNIKLERISVEFAKRINDAFTSAGVAITTGDQDGVVLAASARMAYINKAMLKLFNDVWMSVQGDRQKFAQIFPELISARTVTTTSGSAYIIATPNLDFFQMIEATVAGIQASVLPSYFYQTVKSGKTPQFKGDASNPMAVEINGTIYFLPDVSAFQTKSAVITILRLPINGGTTGTGGIFLTMDASTSEDSPFLNTWNTKIVDIAEQLFRQDAKE